jgi:D-arabinose 1-dehydrogenase-like Zn-dependent alcohol dehydrogenase
MVSGVLCEPFSAHKAYRLGVIMDLVPALKLDGKVQLRPFVEQRPLDEINAVFEAVHAHRMARRAILVPGA